MRGKGRAKNARTRTRGKAGALERARGLGEAARRAGAAHAVRVRVEGGAREGRQIVGVRGQQAATRNALRRAEAVAIAFEEQYA